MEAILYAEVYLICMLVLLLLLFWSRRTGTYSTQEVWTRRVLTAFLLNFTANALFTLVFHGLLGNVEGLFWPYVLKTLYFVTLDIGVYLWCGYAETEAKRSIFHYRGGKSVVRFALLAVPLLIAVVNLFTHQLFYFNDSRQYTRSVMFHVNMLYLFGFSGVCALRLLILAQRDSDPARVSRLRLTASFPVCILMAWLLSFMGESVPVICVSVMLELLCLYLGMTMQQVSLDKLTQVNNRQNLTGFMNYKLAHHDGELHLLMIDVDKFKQINDTYGHPEGDRALICVANALKQACAPFPKRPYIARFGGDEFIIVMEGTQEEADRLKHAIVDSLNAQESADAPYRIGLSIGDATYVKGQSMKEFMDAADKLMYTVKNGQRVA